MLLSHAVHASTQSRLGVLVDEIMRSGSVRRRFGGEAVLAHT